RGMVVLTYLNQAARLNLPLARMLDAAQVSETPRTGKRLRRLRDLLEDGAPLDAALASATPEVSPRIVGLIGAAERSGRLPQALARTVDESNPTSADDDAQTRDAFTRWYPAMMTLGVVLMVSFILIFVMPKFEDIYKDFGLRLPPATQSLLRISRSFADT